MTCFWQGSLFFLLLCRMPSAKARQYVSNAENNPNQTTQGNYLTNKKALKTHVKPATEWLMVKMTNLSVKGVMTSLPEFPKYSYPY